MKGIYYFINLAILALLSQFSEIGIAKEKKAAPGQREKIISREGRSKVSKDKTKVDFEDTDISGARKAPMASMLNNTKAKKEYDMVPIRMDWKPEMVQSASSLDAGKSN